MKEKEVVFDLSVAGWITDIGVHMIYVQLAGTGPLGKLRGSARFNPADESVSLNGKQGIRRISGWKSTDVPGLVDAVKTCAREWLAANPDSLSEYLAARQRGFIEEIKSDIQKTEEKLESLRCKLQKARDGKTWEDIRAEEYEALYASYRREDREVEGGAQ